MSRNAEHVTELTRRDFVRVTAAATAAVALPEAPAPAARADTLRIGVIGCGGRGTGATKDCLTSSERV